MFLIVLDWSLPYLIETETIRDRIQQQFNELTGGEIEFGRMELDLIPWPRIEINKAKISIPPNIQATASTVQIYPNLQALFFSRSSVADILLVSGNLTVNLKPILPDAESTNNILGTQLTLQDLQSGLTRIPKLHIGLKKSRLQLIRGKQLLVELKEVDADVNHFFESLKFEVSCTSEDWKRIRVAGQLSEESIKGQGEITLEELKLNKLNSFLTDDSPIHIEDGLANVDMNFRIDSLDTFSISGTGSLPSIVLSTDRQRLKIRNEGFSVQADVDGKFLNLVINDMILQEPELQVSSARLSIHRERPNIELEMTARSIDVSSTRTIALGLFGNNTVADTIFDIIREGAIPELHLSSRATSVHELGRPANLVIQGALANGDLHIPGIKLDLSDSSGNVRIANGQLRGTNLNARFGNSMASQGELKLGLKALPLPFDLSFNATASHSDLLPILMQLPATRKFEKQLSRFKELKGSATGRVLLKGNMANLKARVNVSEIQLTARHESLPFLMGISTGRFTLDDVGIRIDQLSGNFGQSAFSGLSGSLAWQPDFPTHVNVGVSELELAELQTWLTSFKPLKKLANYRLGGRSRVHLTEAKLNGPLLQPARWRFNLSGKMNNIEIAKLPDLEKPLKIDSGSFKIDTRTLQFNKLHFRVLDADGTVSGFQKQYRSRFNHNGRISLAAHLGKDASQHLGHFFNLERKFRLPPLDLDATEISWKSSDKIRLSGTAVIEKGPKIIADINYGPEEFNIHRLRVTDRFSTTLIALQRSKSLFKLSFKGNLDSLTLQPFVIRNDFLLGSIRGNFDSRLNLLQPARSITHGDLMGEKINLAGFLEIPLLVHNFVLKADKNRIYLQTAEFALADNQMKATGILAPRAKTLQIDLNFATPLFNWENIAKNPDSPQTPGSTSRIAHSSFPALRGKIRFQAERFKFHQFIWTPLYAELNFTEQRTVANLSNTRLCGISTPSRIELSPEQVIHVKIRPSAKNQPIEPALKCLFGKHLNLDGNFNLTGEIKGAGTKLDLPKSFKGQLLLDAENGRIYKELVFFKILDYLNASETLTGNLAGLNKSGISYDSMHTRIDIVDGILHFSDLSMDSPTMKLAGIGEINLDKKTINAKFLVAPLKTVNRILDYVPVVGDILEDVVSIPIELKGPLTDPKVTPLSPAAIGAQLMNIFSRTLNAPVKLIQPVLPEDNK